MAAGDAKLDEVIAAIRASGDPEVDRGEEEYEDHALFPALPTTYRTAAEKRLRMKVPDGYARLLDRVNGMWIFRGSLSLAGLRPDTQEIAHPTGSLQLANVDERPPDASDDMFFFGFYDWDGSHLYADGDGRVHRAERDEVEPLQTWDSVADAIHAEFFRLAELFEDGFDARKRTTPR